MTTPAKAILTPTYTATSAHMRKSASAHLRTSSSVHTPKRRGFTLIEIIMVVGLIGIVTTLVIGPFHQMSSAWREVKAKTRLNAVANNLLAQMDNDFSNVVSARISGERLRGTTSMAGALEDDAVTFKAVVPPRAEQPSTAATVSYRIKRTDAHGTLIRDEGGLEAALQPGEAAVTRLRIEYTEDGLSGWAPGWDRPSLPRAVRVSMALADPDMPWVQLTRRATFYIAVD